MQKRIEISTEILTKLIFNINKKNPTLATEPFITTINDILGLIIYFIIGENLLI